MQAVFIILGVSILTLIFLLFLFRFEARRGARFFEGPRTSFDGVVSRVVTRLQKMGFVLGREPIRQSVHYLFHNFLQVLKGVLKRIETWIDGLLRTNKALAKKAADAKTTRSKLDEIAEHKAMTTLTPKERKIHKEKSIGTKL